MARPRRCIHYQDPRSVGRAKHYPMTLCGRKVEDVPAGKTLPAPLRDRTVLHLPGDVKTCERCLAARNGEVFLAWYDDHVADDDYSLTRP